MTEDFHWLALRLEAPMAAFGGVAIDQLGVTRDYPAASMLTNEKDTRLFQGALPKSPPYVIQSPSGGVQLPA